MNSFIPMLVTLDIHCYKETEKEIPSWLEETMRLFDSLSIKATYFFPAIFAEQFKGHVRMLLSEGHEIGCHGLTHGQDEQYNLMPYEKQEAILREAKHRIEEVVLKEVVSFRSPVFKINGDTIRALEKNGFRYDSSINPQRLGVLSSDVTNLGWMYSPREPYHPSFSSPFIRGNSSIWEIPQSSFIVPFISNTSVAFGEVFIKLFFKTLYLEARFKKIPIIYMFHPEDIYLDRKVPQYRFHWTHIFPSRKKGFLVRNLLYNNKNPKTIARPIINLLKTMKDSKDIKFMIFREIPGLL